MPSYESIFNETRNINSSYDLVRQRYIKDLYEITGRNLITYYNGVLQKDRSIRKFNFGSIGISAEDKENLIDAASNMDVTKGLDIILHYPHEGINSEIAVVESLVKDLRAIFGNNIRAIIPQLTTSTGTMIAVSCKEILMNNCSCMRPIDPVISGLSANGILDEIERAQIETGVSRGLHLLWRQIIGKYDQDFVNNCQDIVIRSMRLVKSSLIECMIEDFADREREADRIWDELGDFSLRRASNYHISLKRAKEIGLMVKDFGETKGFGDIVFKIHYLYLLTFANTDYIKIIENQTDKSFIQHLKT